MFKAEIYSPFAKQQLIGLLVTRSGGYIETASPINDPAWDGWYLSSSNQVDFLALAIPDGQTLDSLKDRLTGADVYLYDDLGFNVSDVTESPFSGWVICEGRVESADD